MKPQPPGGPSPGEQNRLALTLGGQVRAIRKSLHLTQTELARQAGVAASAVARLEKGRSVPTISTLRRIAGALGRHLDISLREHGAAAAHLPGIADEERISVLVVDSLRLFTEALTTALGAYPDLRVLPPPSAGDSAMTGLQAMEAVLKKKPDVAVLDYWFPVTEGPEIARLLRGWEPGIKVLLMSWFHGPQIVEAALSSGAVGYLPKTLEVGELVEAIRRAHAGESPVFREHLETFLEKLGARADESDEQWERLRSLTPREIEILRLLGYGRPIKEIAESLSIASGTLRVHVQKILGKLGAASRLEAVLLARTHGLIRT